MKKMYILSVPV